MKAIRDTDADWREIGATEPYHGVLTNADFLRRNLTNTSLAEFWESGRRDVASFFETFRRQFGEFSPTTALDFGCGVGRLTRALAANVASVTGIDVSPGMLAEAQIGAPENVSFSEVIPEGTVDWIMSHIVFQHIPPSRGYQLFEDLLGRLNPGGGFMVHFTIYKDREFLPQSFNTINIGSWDGHILTTFDAVEQPSGTMLMFDYDLSRLVAIAHQANVNSLYMDHLNHGGCHGVAIFGRKAH